MTKDNQLIVNEKDLNGVQNMAGKGSVNPRNVTTSNLKGALSEYKLMISFNDELQFISTMSEQIVEYKTEQLEYKNLPEGLTKYRLEKKLIENGSIAILKQLGVFVAVNYTTNTWNIYGEPNEIIVNEPRSLSLNGNRYSILKGEAVIVRENLFYKPVSSKTMRLLKALEKTLFQIEKNLTTSAPKGILNPQDMEIVFDEQLNNAHKNSMEVIVNGQDTFYVLKRKPDDDEDTNLIQNDEPLYIPIELTDRTETLWKNYLNIKEQIKEIIGAYSNANIGKKERTIETEVTSQQDLSLGSWKHPINIRKQDILEVNKVFGTNISIEVIEEQEDTSNEDEGGEDE